jgi:hypothetical protein
MIRRLALLVLLSLLARSALAQNTPCISDCIARDALTGPFGLSAEQIADLDRIELDGPSVDRDLLHDRRYQRVDGALAIHDAPGGSVIRTLDAGFNFVTTINTEGDWTEINPGEWVSSAALRDTNYIVSEFHGVFLPRALPDYTIAWMLKNAYASSYPGGPALESNRLLYRYTRLSIYAEHELDGWRWYQVGPEEWVHQTLVAKVLPVERPAEVKTWRWVSIDLYEQIVIAYEGKIPVFATLVSTGLPRWPTEEGLFNIYYRRVREYMSWGTPGDDFYALEEVPWTMYFDQGRALHGAYWHDGLGYRRSHGCVNMAITDAHWLYRWVSEEFESLNSPGQEDGPAVLVYSSGTYR